MSLQLAAQHLQAHGRGNDSHLVHMTTGELKALQDLAVHNGGSLTINPHTGLPEAGFLSKLLPMVAGAALNWATGGTWSALEIAGTVGLADTMLTGSLGEGLMAGLGAWGGANLAADVAAFNPAADTSTLVDKTLESSKAVTDAGLPQGTQALNTSVVDAGGVMSANPEIANQAMSGVGNTASSNMVTGANGTLYDPEYLAANKGFTQAVASPAATAAKGPWGTSQDFAGNWDKLKQGASNIAEHPGQFLNKNLWDVGSVALPLISEATKPDPYQPAPREKNPMHLKENPAWSGPTQPDQPNPYYTAQYRDYVRNPYTAASGGLMDVSRFAAGDEVDYHSPNMQKLLADMSKTFEHKDVDLPAGHKAYHTGLHDSGVYQLSNADYAASSPLALMAKHKVKVSQGLAPTMALGDFSTDPAMISQQQIAQDRQTESAKEGGLTYADGGVTHLASGNYLVPNSGNYKVDPTAAAAAATNPMQALQGLFSGQIPQNSQTPADPLQGFKDLISGGMGNLSPGPKDLSALSKAFGGPQPTDQNMNWTSNGQPTSSSNVYDMLSKSGLADSPFGQMWMKMMGLNAPATATQMPKYDSQNLSPDFGLNQNGEVPVNTNIYIPKYAVGGVPMAMGGLGDLGSYSDGGRLLKGPGDGVSDSIPASIGHKQPARLAEGEFVIPARIVSELGNGSTDAGAKRLYAMMDRVKAKRSKTKNIAADTKAYQYLPA